MAPDTAAAEPTQRHVSLGDADGPTKALLISLAEYYENDHRRPCCDADTTLQDWYDALGTAEVEHFLRMVEPHACDECGTVYDEAGGDGYCGLCPSCADKGVEPHA